MGLGLLDPKQFVRGAQAARKAELVGQIARNLNYQIPCLYTIEMWASMSSTWIFLKTNIPQQVLCKTEFSVFIMYLLL